MYLEESSVGECCGTRVFWGFQEYHADELKQRQAEIRGLKAEIYSYTPKRIRDYYNPNSYEYVTEALDVTNDKPHTVAMVLNLTDEQLQDWDSYLAKEIKKLGFKRVFRWINPNTDRYVNMFVRGKNKRKGVPYAW